MSIGSQRVMGDIRMRFVIEGAPRTKKNHMRIVRVRGGPVPIQAASHDAWSRAAILQLQSQCHGLRANMRCEGVPLNLRALVYRDRAVGDLGNYLAAVCDALERAAVVADDKWIMGFDGSRLLIDRARPRIEIELAPLP